MKTKQGTKHKRYYYNRKFYKNQIRKIKFYMNKINNFTSKTHQSIKSLYKIRKKQKKSKKVKIVNNKNIKYKIMLYKK